MFAPFILLRYVMKVPITFDIFWQIIKKMIFGGTGFFANLNKMFNSGIGSTVEQGTSTVTVVDGVRTMVRTNG